MNRLRRFVLGDPVAVGPELWLQGTDGFFYGTGFGGGAGRYGTVFRIDSTGNAEPLVQFGGDNGANPSDLIQGRDGSLYGTASGRVFKLTPDGRYSAYVFDSTDGSTNGHLVESVDGTLYGVTCCGRYGSGSIFRITF